MSFDTMFEHTHCSMQSIKPIPLYMQLNSEVIVVISRMDGMDMDQIQMLSLKDLQGFHQSARFMRYFEYDENPIGQNRCPERGLCVLNAGWILGEDRKGRRR